jgi:hypothetical protein
MKTWEIAKGMCEGIYKVGDIFRSTEIGDMIITEDEELCYLSWQTVPILIGDDSEWELIRRE